jgi:lysine N-acyltransferase
MSEILLRELPDVSDEVRNIPPPPVPEAIGPCKVRIADPDADAERLSDWFNRPHLVKAWQCNFPPEKWHGYISAQLAGTYSRPLIMSLDGQDLMYIERYRAAKDYIATRYRADPYDLGVHAAILDPASMNMGHSQSLTPAGVATIFDEEPQCRRIMLETDHLNVKARRLCERVGCGFLGEHDMPNRRIALYVLPRTPEDTPLLGDVPTQQ